MTGQSRPKVDEATGLRSSDSRLPPMPPLGFRNYWYPAMVSRRLRDGAPVDRMLLGERIAFFRTDGEATAIQDNCPHRGASLTLGRSLAPGTVSCRYHGFTFDVKSGACIAALTEGPESRSVHALRARTYPVRERHGIVWVFMGEGEPPPLEADLPEELLDDDIALGARFSEWETNWRVSVDNGCDVAHVPYLHRSHPFVRFKDQPATFEVDYERDGPWLKVLLKNIRMEASFPRIGTWPRDRRFRRPTAPGKEPGTALRLPGVVKINFPGKYTHFRWSVPIDVDRTLVVQCLAKPATGIRRWMFLSYYYLWQKWIYHVWFQHDDREVLETIGTYVPEVPTQSDKMLIAWRRMAKEAR